jgi:peroxiredoxin
MKKLIYLLIFPVVLAGCSTKPHYSVTGKIDGADTLTFLLQKNEAGKLVSIDSAVAHKGTFRMHGGPIKYPEMVMLTAKNSRMRTRFYLENSDITITGRLDSLFNAKISGSVTQDQYQEYVNLNKPLVEKYSKIYAAYQTASQNNDTARVASLEREADSVQSDMTKLQKEFIRNNPKSFVAPTLLSGLSIELEADELEGFVNGLDTAVANTQEIKELKERITKMKSVAVGQKAPDFTLNDPEGKPVSLSSKIGSKLLLIDFWAGWCGPCRRENPNVVKVFTEFHKKGFDVIGVSLDQNKDEWVKAISSDNLAWTHVSDLQYWNSAAARLYAVSAIPANFLLDQNGVIIAKNLRGDALTTKVKEVLEAK